MDTRRTNPRRAGGQEGRHNLPVSTTDKPTGERSESDRIPIQDLLQPSTAPDQNRVTNTATSVNGKVGGDVETLSPISTQKQDNQLQLTPSQQIAQPSGPLSHLGLVDYEEQLRLLHKQRDKILMRERLKQLKQEIPIIQDSPSAIQTSPSATAPVDSHNSSQNVQQQGDGLPPKQSRHAKRRKAADGVGDARSDGGLDKTVCSPPIDDRNKRRLN